MTGVRAVVGEATYSVVYGYQDRKLSSITHGGFAYGFTYDGMGRAKKVTIAGADYTENEYTLGETTTVTTSYAGGERMKVETDRHEQPVKRTYTDKNGVETVIAEGEYDSLGKPVKVLDKITQKAYTYTYDGYENVTTEKVNDAAYKEYEYDEQNRLMSTTFHVGDETQTYRPIYDTRKSDGAVYADNAVVGVTLEGVFTSKAEQDDWGRVTEKKLTITGATTPLLSEEYGYLDVSVGFETRLTTMVQLLTRKVNGVTKDTLRYTYDNNGNITAIRNGAGTEYYAKYTYDGLNQLIREDNAVLGKSWVFAYDTAGNILSKKEYAYTTGTLGAVLDTKTYTYAATGWKDRLTSFNGEPIAYDALGAPVLTNRAVHISVAHCAGRIAVCASPERCAVDIEPATRDFRRAASRYLTPEEEALSDDPLLPGIVWCAKETLYKYAGRRELDFRRDLHVVRLDLAAGTLAGRIGNGEPVRLSVSLDEGFILVYIL